MAKKKTKMQKFAKHELGKFKRGTLHSGSKRGPKVTSKKQALAIMLSEARKKGLYHGKVAPKRK